MDHSDPNRIKYFGKLLIGGGGTYGGIFKLSKTHVSDDFWGYLEHKTLNMYGSIFF